MFGRRRHAAPVSASKLTEKQLFDLVHARLASELGANGAWVLSRRAPDSGDEIFHEVYAQQLAHDIATDIDLEQAAVTVRTAESTGRGWRLWGRQSEDVEDEPATETVAATPPALVDEPSSTSAVSTEQVEVEQVEVEQADTEQAEVEQPDTEQAETEQLAANADTEDADAFVEPTFVERTLLEPQHYPITVWAEPEFIDASLVNPMPARRSSVG